MYIHMYIYIYIFVHMYIMHMFGLLFDDLTSQCCPLLAQVEQERQQHDDTEERELEKPGYSMLLYQNHMKS